MPAAYDSPDFALFSDGVRTLFAGVTMTATRGLLITMGQVSYIKVPSVESDKNRQKRLLCLHILRADLKRPIRWE